MPLANQKYTANISKAIIHCFLFTALSLTGCATVSASIESAPRGDNQKNLVIYGEEVPLLSSDKPSEASTELINTLDVVGKKNDNLYIFDFDKSPIYYFKFNEPVVVVGVNIQETMKLLSMSNSWDDTHLHLYEIIGNNIVFSAKNYVNNEYLYTKNPTFRGEQFINKLDIKIISTRIDNKQSYNRLAAVSPHVVSVSFFTKSEVYKIVKRVLGERADKNANTNLLSVIKKNDNDLYWFLTSEI